MPVESIIFGLIILVVIGAQLYINTSSFNKEPPQNEQGDFVLKKPVVLSIMSMIAFLYIFGGNKFISDGTLPSSPFIYILFAILVTTTVLAYRANIKYNQMGFTVFNGFTAAKEYAWTDVNGFNGVLKRGKTLKLNNGKIVRIDGQYIGLKHFYEFAASHTNQGQV